MTSQPQPNLRLRPFALLVLAAGCAEIPPGGGPDVCSAKDESELAAWAENPSNAEDCVLHIRNTELTSLDALSGLRRIGGFIIEDNAALRDITALKSIEPFPILTVRRSPLSDDVDVSNVLDDVRFEGTESRRIAGTQTAVALLHVRDNAQVESISFPDALNIGSIGIDANPELAGFGSAFPSAVEVHRLSVTNSPLIAAAEIEAFGARTNVPAAELFHCGNADDGECEELPSFD